MFNNVIDLISSGISKCVDGIGDAAKAIVGYRPKSISRLNQLMYKLTKRPPWYKYYGDNNDIDYPNLSIYGLIDISYVPIFLEILMMSFLSIVTQGLIIGVLVTSLITWMDCNV